MVDLIPMGERRPQSGRLFRLPLPARPLVAASLGLGLPRGSAIKSSLTRRGGRVADCTGLENRHGASHRGFESLPLRSCFHEMRSRLYDLSFAANCLRNLATFGETTAMQYGCLALLRKYS